MSIYVMLLRFTMAEHTEGTCAATDCGHAWLQDLYKDFSTPEDAQKVVKLKAFNKCENTTEALAAAAALVDSKLSKGACACCQHHPAAVVMPSTACGCTSGRRV